QSYLEAGLHGSFADYPQKGRLLSSRVRTPMDYDINEVVQYLESQVQGASHQSDGILPVE
ncbi:MAG TPA: hypothetical protein VJ987_13000, partial [Anaerolineales bacterium]|nr:hypothetical protein [Anaerolineales bacterium]